MLIEELAQEYRTQYNVLCAKMDGLRPLLSVYGGEDLYRLRRKLRTCLRAFYVDGKSQTEIARRLGLSQATVSYHIHAAKAAANRLLHYCQIAVAKANDCWLEAENNGL